MSRISVAVILLALAGLVIYFGDMRQWQIIQESRKEIARLQNVGDELVRLERKRDELTEEYNRISQENLDKLDSIIPATTQTSATLVDFESIAEKNGVLVQTVDFSSGKGGAVDANLAQNSIYKAIPLSMSVLGHYESLVNFLRDLERNLRLVDINEVGFGVAGGLAGQTGTSVAAKNITAQLRGMMYYQPQ